MANFSSGGFASDCRYIRDESLASFAGNFGLASVVSLLLIREYFDGEQTRRESLIIPNLVMRTSEPRQYQTDFEVTAREDLLTLSGIPFSVGRGWLEATGTSYWINGILTDNDKVKNGFEVEYISLNDTDSPLAWTLEVRRKPDERRFD
ncbi:MAG TPA: hypothetical protein V6D33_01060 [Cyanophyceae cyanobacterium]